jgi:hypothetical protein
MDFGLRIRYADLTLFLLVPFHMYIDKQIVFFLVVF